MKVLLLFPPHWEPMMPHLALPSLTAYLRSNGVEVIQRDLNAETFDRLLSQQHLQAVLRQLRQQARRLDHPHLSPALRQYKTQAAAWAEEHGKIIAEQIETAKSVVRSSRFFDRQYGLPALRLLMNGLQLASLPYYPSALELTGYHSAYPIDASRALHATVADREHNLFRTLFQTWIVPQIRQERPDVIGISLVSADQVVAGLTLAALIKEAGLPAHIVLGGKMITCWRDQLPRAAALWDLFDSAVVMEGEVALLRLIEALDGGKDLSTVPNLMYREGNRVRVNPTKEPEPVTDLPIPDFDGLPLDLYLAPAHVLPVSAARGCYWGRCAFCNVGYGESCHFDERHTTQVAEEMVTLANRHNTPYFFFADEALSPRMLKQLSARLIEIGADLCWTCCARFEPGIDAALLRQMRRAGCRMVLYGLESGSQRVLDRMHKGTRLETAQRILREGAEAGIWNHIFFFFGFPGETEQDARETIQFFKNQQNVVHSVCTGTFLLERDACVAGDPAAYGVSHLFEPEPQRDLAYYYDYQIATGVDAARAEQIEQAFVDSLPEKPDPQCYLHDIYRFLYACQQKGTLPTMIG